MLAVKNDSELDRLFGDAVISTGGVMPNIHSVLLPKNTKKKSGTVVDNDAMDKDATSSQNFWAVILDENLFYEDYFNWIDFIYFLYLHLSKSNLS